MMQVDKRKVDETRKLFDASRKGELWTPRNVILAIVAVLYLVSPIDIVPDWLFPLVGWLDDVGVLTAAVCWILTHRGPAKS
jgi:uncharacterized membrane protein YkvA (DUF1232 family)